MRSSQAGQTRVFTPVRVSRPFPLASNWRTKLEGCMLLGVHRTAHTLSYKEGHAGPAGQWAVEATVPRLKVPGMEMWRSPT